jgi:hypothetical protein
MAGAIYHLITLDDLLFRKEKPMLRPLLKKLMPRLGLTKIKGLLP